MSIKKHDHREYRKYTESVYEKMLKDRGLDIKPEISYSEPIRVKNSEDWHKFEFRKGRDGRN